MPSGIEALRKRPGPAILLACVLSVFFLLANRLDDGRFGVALDDSWIHLAYARTFSETGRWALTPAMRSSSGCSGVINARLAIIRPTAKVLTTSTRR